jgi:hypothetical protein
MKIHIDLEHQTIEMHEQGDFAGLTVEAAADTPSPTEVDKALRAADAGRADDTHAFLSLEWLEQAADVRARGTNDSFARMVAYATQHGWVDPGASTVRAHLVWLSPAT